MSIETKENSRTASSVETAWIVSVLAMGMTCAGLVFSIASNVMDRVFHVPAYQELVSDGGTGCQYILVGNVITPRYGRDGNQICTSGGSQ